MNCTRTQSGVELVRDGAWDTGRLAVLILLLFVAHIGFVLLFAERSKQTATQVQRGQTSPHIVMVHEHKDAPVFASDPTLFVWPSANTFSGSAWFKKPSIVPPAFEWTDPPALLALSGARLGSWLESVFDKNHAHRFEVAEKIAVDFVVPVAELFSTMLRDKSTLAITGDIASRRLLTQLDLPSWHAEELLRPSIVRVVVDANGQVHSATLLSQSGSAEADKFALDLARSTDWEPVPGNRQQPLGSAPTGLTVGTLIFSWHTKTAATTNTPARSD